MNFVLRTRQTLDSPHLSTSKPIGSFFLSSEMMNNTNWQTV